MNDPPRHKVPPDALPAARAALRHLWQTDRPLCLWVLDGAPNLSEAEHLVRFGEPYRVRPRRAK